MNNQNAITDLIAGYTIPTVLLVTILLPLAEEIVFRYSLGTLIKNNIAFLIVSSLLFAIFHGIGIVTIVYILQGLAFGIAYLKSDRNFMASFIVHLLNNIIAVALILIA